MPGASVGTSERLQSPRNTCCSPTVRTVDLTPPRKARVVNDHTTRKQQTSTPPCCSNYLHLPVASKTHPPLPHNRHPNHLRSTVDVLQRHPGRERERRVLPGGVRHVRRSRLRRCHGHKRCLRLLPGHHRRGVRGGVLRRGPVCHGRFYPIACEPGLRRHRCARR